MDGNYIPERGDLIWINFNPQSGHEQSGKRPALVISPAKYNIKTGLALVVPVTQQKKGYPFEVEIPHKLLVSGVVLSDQVKCLDWRVRKAMFICKLDQAVTIEVLKKLGTLI